MWGSAIPRCRPKDKARERILLPVRNDVSDILAYSAAETQVMVFSRHSLRETYEPGAFNQLDAYRFEVVQRAGSRSGFGWHIRNRELARALTDGSPRGQDNVATPP
jgi:hypothetical protein